MPFMPTERSSSIEEPSPKRLRLSTSSDTDESDSLSLFASDRRSISTHQLSVSHVLVPDAAFAPSASLTGCTPALQRCQEYQIIHELQVAFQSLQLNSHNTSPDYTFFRLDDFTIYRPNPGKHAGEMASLDKLLNNRFPTFHVDGTLSVGATQLSVKGIPFQTMTIDGYLDPNHSIDLDGKICIQSTIAKKANIWYQLGRPSATYTRFHEPFQWLAQFTKIFVQYLSDYQAVTLSCFRRHFYKWLTALHQSEAVVKWASKVNFTDFRSTVAANVAFLYKECYSIDDQEIKVFINQPIWGEVDPGRLEAIPRQRRIEQRTIVTPFAYECFQRSYFGDQLEMRTIHAPMLWSDVAARKSKMRLTPMVIPTTTPIRTTLEVHKLPLSFVKVGNVVCVEPDSIGWKTSTSTVWYAYVQNCRRNANQVRLDVIWLYHPSDTTLGKAHYPFENELFLSDNCSCGKEAIHLEHVTAKVEVSWFVNDPYTHIESGLFVRRKFRTVAEDDTFDFVDLQKTDFTCHCNHKTSIWDEIQEQYSVGDTLLYRDGQKLEVAQIIEFGARGGAGARTIHARRYFRKNSFDITARPNELVATNEVIQIHPEACIRHCYVRCFKFGILSPYDRDGAGDHFFVQSELDNIHHTPFSQTKREVPLMSKPKLIGMGLFCGGGNFDRGLEEGNGVDFQYAIDYAEHALHSYRANAERPDIQYFLGSVDDYLAQAIAGRVDDKRIALPGDFDFLSAGSPCQGFSALQNDKNSAGSKRNASRIASVVSFVDLYSPKYFILENVIALTHNQGPGENVFSQLLAALVALGYQVQQFLMDAWSYGSPQRRSRVFIVASAPGLKPLDHPAVSHGYPTSWKFRSVALGISSSGLRFGVRHNHFTPFEHVSARQSIEDLPNIGDAQVQLCPQFPDHRTCTEESAQSRDRMVVVPVRPRGMGLMQAFFQGRLQGEPREWCERSNAVRKSANSKVYRRVLPDDLFPTIVTKLQPADGRAGRVLHWDQHRVLTVMEARRAQGFPDHEVIIGSPAQQMEIVGNSVERNTALVLGIRLRESWMSSDQATFEIRNEQQSDNGLVVGNVSGGFGSEQVPYDVTRLGIEMMSS